MEIIDWIILSLFFLIIIPLGLSYRKFSSKGLTAYFLGGRNLPWWLAGISMVATTFAADTPLAVTELVGSGGVSANWLWWNFLMGGMLTTFFFARLWRRAEVLTEVELIELRYGGKGAAMLRGFKALYLGLFLNIIIMGWVNLAMMTVLEIFFDLSKVEALLATALLMISVSFYVSYAGLKGIAVTDAVQFVIAMSASVLLAIFVVNSPEIGGITALREQLNTNFEGTLSFFPSIGKASTIEQVNVLTITVGSFLAYMGFQWWASWYPGAEPGGGGYVAQRMMSTKNERHAIFATLFFQLAHYCLRPWPWIIVGLCVLIIYPELTQDTQREGYVRAILDYMPAGLKGLMLGSFIAAYMSTISTQLNWGSSYVINDFYKRFISSGEESPKDIYFSKIAVWLLMAAALLITLFMDSVSGVWTFLIECGAGLGMVLILRWFWWRINVWSEFSATITPFLVLAVLKIITLILQSSFDPGPGVSDDERTLLFEAAYPWLMFPGSFFVIILVTTISWLSVTFLTQPEDQSTLKRFYTKVRPGGWWSGVAQTAKADSRILPWLFAAWISAVVFAYMVLFSSGKFLFGEYTAAIQFTLIGLTALFVLLFVMRKLKSFESEETF